MLRIVRALSTKEHIAQGLPLWLIIGSGWTVSDFPAIYAVIKQDHVGQEDRRTSKQALEMPTPSLL